MSAISKISDITYADIAEYLRLTEYTGDVNMLNTLLGAAKSYIEQYTGRTVAELDNYPDCVIVVYILVQDMWDNRTLYVDKNNVNRVVDSILGLHQVNLLPVEGVAE